jgi:hypothetical protein
LSDGSSLLGGHRREKRPRVVVAGTAFFGLLSAAALVELARGVPLRFGAQVAAPTESALYRASAAVSCAALAGWLYLAGGRRREAERR